MSGRARASGTTPPGPVVTTGYQAAGGPSAPGRRRRLQSICDAVRPARVRPGWPASTLRAADSARIHAAGGPHIDGQTRRRGSLRSGAPESRRAGRADMAMNVLQYGMAIVAIIVGDPAWRSSADASSRRPSHAASAPGCTTPTAQDREVDAKARPGRLARGATAALDRPGRTGRPGDLETVAAAVGIDRHLSRAGWPATTGRADLTQYSDHVHLVLQAMDAAGIRIGRRRRPERQEIDLVAGRNWVVTVHYGPIAALDRIEERPTARHGSGRSTRRASWPRRRRGARRLPRPRRGDRAGDRPARRAGAPDAGRSDDVLSRIVALRRRIGTIRRTLTPHRLAFAALARPGDGAPRGARPPVAGPDRPARPGDRRRREPARPAARHVRHPHGLAPRRTPTTS